MKGSEIVSIVWIVFYASFVIAAIYLADRSRNKQLIEQVGAWIFSMIALASVAGAYAPKFSAMALDIWWYSNSNLNAAASVLSIILTWAAAFVAWEWLVLLAFSLLSLGGVAWVVTRFIL